MNDITVGLIMINSEGYSFTVIEPFGVDKNRRKMYKVKFINTGYEVVTSSQNIRRGNVKDYIQPEVCDVGYLGCNTRFNKLPHHSKLYTTWKNMLSRCYDVRSVNYNSYGAKGTYVCTEWHNYSIFFYDAQQLHGWDGDNTKGLTIDKDGIIQGNKCYSKDLCQWVTLKENNNIKIMSQRNIVGISPDNQSFTFCNISEFAKKHNLTAPNIHLCLRDKSKKHKGWKFKHKEEKQ